MAYRLRREQRRTARIFLSEARRGGASPRTRKALIEAGIVEANLENPRGGDASSVGSLQEQSHYGSVRRRLNRRLAARRFVQEATALERRGFRGGAGELAQAVQRSAFPGRYRQHSREAEAIVRSVGGGGGGGGDLAGGGGGFVDSSRGLPERGGQGAADILSALIAPPKPRVPSGLGVPEPAFSARSRVPMPKTPLNLEVPSSGPPEPPHDFNSLLDMATKVQGGDIPHTTVSGGGGGAVSDGGVGVGGTGRVKVAGSANRPGHGIQRGTMRFLERVAGAAGETITVGTGTNHKQFTTTGNQSDHWTGHGADIPVPYLSKQGDRIAAAALMSAGVPEKRAHAMARRGGLYTLNFHGHRIQVIWRVQGAQNGGDHTRHVHIGFR